jgi:hypothetical protein
MHLQQGIWHPSASLIEMLETLLVTKSVGGVFQAEVDFHNSVRLYYFSSRQSDFGDSLNEPKTLVLF